MIQNGAVYAPSVVSPYGPKIDYAAFNIDKFQDVVYTLPAEFAEILGYLNLRDLTEIRVVLGYPFTLNFDGVMVRFDGHSARYKEFLLPRYKDHDIPEIRVEKKAYRKSQSGDSWL